MDVLDREKLMGEFLAPCRCSCEQGVVARFC